MTGIERLGHRARHPASSARGHAGPLCREARGASFACAGAIYARIADRTVAEEYFAVTEKVEALYEGPRTLPADEEGAEMRKLRAGLHRRKLGGVRGD